MEANQLPELIEKGKKLAQEMKQFKENYPDFHLCTDSAFSIFYVNIEDFKAIFKEHNPEEIQIDKEHVRFTLNIAERGNGCHVTIPVMCETSEEAFNFYRKASLNLAEMKFKS